MSAFLSRLIVADDGGFPFTLMGVLTYQSDRLKRTLIVPNGFKTDFASIPRALWAVLPPVGGYDRAAVVHDFLYQNGGVSRGDADGVLLEAMEAVGVSRITRWTIYAGVRSGGWLIWHKYRAKDSK